MRLLYLIVALTLACGSPTEPNEERRLAIIHLEDIEPPGTQRPFIEIPDTVAVSTPFIVSVVTEVGGCKRGGETEVLMSGNITTITVYDASSAENLGSNQACTDDLRFFVHGALLFFTARGAATVVVRGATYSPTLTEVEYEFDVWVE